MSQIYCVSCILSIDHKKKENLVVSSSNNKDSITFPIFKIEHPKLLWNELRYHIAELFFDNGYNKEIIKNITFSYTGIQNELIIRYIESLNNKDYNTDEDIFLLSSIILEQPYDMKTYSWEKFKFVKSFQNMDLFNSIIDYIIQQSIL